MPKLKTFKIDIKYCCDVADRKEHYRAKDPANPTARELLDIISNGPVKYSTAGNKDHPEFSKLRNMLGDLGYIAIERAWWNGDRVLKSFRLNGVLFRKGDQFPCASAIKWGLTRHLRKKVNYEEG